MISQDDLLTLMHDLESDRVERTTSLSNTGKFSQAVCAFANDMPNHRKPGYLMIGVQDNGQLNQLVVTDELLKTLAALRSNGAIQPLPVISVEQFSFPEGQVAVVEVLPSDLPPVRFPK